MINPCDGGSSPSLSAKLFERSARFKFVLARFVPVRRFARWADSRLADCSLSRLPFMGATITFIPFSLERDHAHVDKILENNILSSRFSLTYIYLISNILFR